MTDMKQTKVMNYWLLTSDRDIQDVTEKKHACEQPALPLTWDSGVTGQAQNKMLKSVIIVHIHITDFGLQNLYFVY